MRSTALCGLITVRVFIHYSVFCAMTSPILLFFCFPWLWWRHKYWCYSVICAWPATALVPLLVTHCSMGNKLHKLHCALYIVCDAVGVLFWKQSSWYLISCYLLCSLVILACIKPLSRGSSPSSTCCWNMAHPPTTSRTYAYTRSTSLRHTLRVTV
jgi:hypothetical protein